MNFIKKIRSGARYATTYRAGLLQTRAYRTLQAYTTKKLTPYGISSAHWVVLGLLNDAGKQGMRASIVAQELEVDAPFITTLLVGLRKKKLVQKKVDPKDSRAGILLLTVAGKRFVAIIEKSLRTEMKPLLRGAHPSDLLSYLSVLETIIENDARISSK